MAAPHPLPMRFCPRIFARPLAQQMAISAHRKTRAYGTDSGEFAQAMNDDWTHPPLERYNARTKAGRATLAAARKCLQQ